MPGVWCLTETIQACGVLLRALVGGTSLGLGGGGALSTCLQLGPLGGSGVPPWLSTCLPQPRPCLPWLPGGLHPDTDTGVLGS